MNWKMAMKHFGHTLKRKSPEILTGIGIAGMITTTILAVKATPEALRRIERKKQELRKKKLEPKETIQAAGKCYIPAAVTGTVSVACLIGASVENGRRNAALATAASLAESTLREYRGKVVETLGEKKEKTAILDSMDKDEVNKNPPPKEMLEQPISEGGTAKILCCDALFGRYFYSNIDTLKRSVNEINRRMSVMVEPYVSVNDFYQEVGERPIEIGDDLGWNVNKGLLELSFSSQLYNGTTPCLVFRYLTPPVHDYYEIA